MALLLLPADAWTLDHLHPRTAGWWDGVLLFLDEYGPRVLLSAAMLGGGGLFLWRRDAPGRAIGLGIVLLPLVANQVTGILKRLVARERPQLADWSHEPLRVILELADTRSFPSGHVTTAAACAFAAGWLVSGRWARMALLAIIPAMMWCRVGLAVHWPSDTFAGIGVACLTLAAWRRLMEKRSPALGARWRPVALVLMAAWCVFLWRHEL